MMKRWNDMEAWTAIPLAAISETMDTRNHLLLWATRQKQYLCLWGIVWQWLLVYFLGIGLAYPAAGPCHSLVMDDKITWPIRSMCLYYHNIHTLCIIHRYVKIPLPQWRHCCTVSISQYLVWFSRKKISLYVDRSCDALISIVALQYFPSSWRKTNTFKQIKLM